MAALSWLPQDDLLLKNSIERGASLDSLARGAVEFSRKFSREELQDRWLSILYDPVVSPQACMKMVELELAVRSSKSKKVNMSKETNLGSEKRKAKSIRSCYYAKKRVCSEQFYQVDPLVHMDNSFINEAGATCLGGVHEDPLESDFGMEDGNIYSLYDVCNSDFGCDFLVGQDNMLEDAVDQRIAMDEQIPSLLGDFDSFGETCRSEEIYGHNIYGANNIEIKPVFDSDCGTSCQQLRYSSSLPEMAAWKTMESMILSEIPDGDGRTGNNVHSIDQVCSMDDTLSNTMSLMDLKNTTDCADDYFADISDIKLKNEDEMQNFDDGDDDASLDGFHTLLLDTLDHVNDDEVCIIPEINKVTSDVTYIRESNTQSRSLIQNNTSSSTFDHHNDVFCCSTNTEAPEIPCNDDLIVPSKRPAVGHKKTQNKATVPLSSGKVNTGNPATGKGLSTMNMEPKHIKKSHSSPSLDVGSNCVVIGLTGTQRGGSRYGALGENSEGIKKECTDLPGCDVAELSGQFVESNHAEMNVAVMNQDIVNCEAPILGEADNELISSEHEELSDSDCDIPSCSDVELMIHDMDLDPSDQDTYTDAKALKYLQEDYVRKLIRLEQNAHSCRQREIALHGAFAVLSGRHSKHYIKKLEVLLGRTTVGANVDIDLTRDRGTNKISRRQASIKLSRDETFSIKNLGRYPIYVNGEEICPRQSVDLHSDCLIDIRDIKFIFQVNQQQVKRFLESAVNIVQATGLNVGESKN